jgi:hypothetical protein
VQRTWIYRVMSEGLNRAELRAAKAQEEEEHAGVSGSGTTDGKEPDVMVACPTCQSIVPERAIYGKE